MKAAASLTLSLALALLQPALGGERKSLYDLTALDANGAKVSLHQYRGKVGLRERERERERESYPSPHQVSLVVNVASHCGYTDLNYRELVKLQEEFSGQGFTVLAFPCNQFGEQEPGTMADITEFARGYEINFPLFHKVDVVGSEASQVYSFLYEATRTRPRWNFGKFLVDRGGAVRQFFSEKGEFPAIRQAVRYLLDKPRTEL